MSPNVDDEPSTGSPRRGLIAWLRELVGSDSQRPINRRASVIVLAVLIGHCFCWSRETMPSNLLTPRRSEHPYLTATLSIERSPFGAVIACVRLVNTGNEVAYLMKIRIRVPLQTATFEVRRGGEKVRYKGIMVNPGPLTAEHYLSLDPGQTYEMRADLSGVYDFSKRGTYHVYYWGPHCTPDMRQYMVASNVVAFDV